MVILVEGFVWPFTSSYLNSLSVFVSSPQETKINCVRLANKGMSTLPLTLPVKTIYIYIFNFNFLVKFVLKSNVITWNP